jgi:hypothetical protein
MQTATRREAEPAIRDKDNFLAAIQANEVLLHSLADSIGHKRPPDGTLSATAAGAAAQAPTVREAPFAGIRGRLIGLVLLAIASGLALNALKKPNEKPLVRLPVIEHTKPLAGSFGAFDHLSAAFAKSAWS